jgi:dTDP-4-amino-4,6-dideoxygalactose transaminase
MSPPSPSPIRVPFAYLGEQFADAEPLFEEIRRLVQTGDFTLGKAVAEFEAEFATFLGAHHAIGVNSGTDALKLSLKALGVGPGDEVITAANTFIATVGAICETGARPVLIDVDDSLCMDPERLGEAIGERTKAILPVHLSGNVADLPRILSLAERHGVAVIEDACQAIGSRLNDKAAGSWGLSGAFSLHPLKFLNVWGDGGVIVTNDDKFAQRLRLLRNHGLIDRDTIVLLGGNSRLDSLQALVARWVLGQADDIVARRNANAARYDEGFAAIAQLRLPPRRDGVLHSYVTYQAFAEDRNALLAHCVARGIECKVHYPLPLYRQPGLEHFGYRAGDFPVADRQAATTITFPVHQYLSDEQIDFAIRTVREFYGT